MTENERVLAELDELRAQVAHWRTARDRAIAAGEVLMDELEHVRLALHEACDWIQDRSSEESLLVERLRRIAGPR